MHFAQLAAQRAAAFVNRNPRNLERLRIARKPDGYHVDKPGRSYWHRLEILRSGRHVTASVVHFENGEVLRASTQEWAIQKQLYSNKDGSAYVNLARVLAQRCLESGIVEMHTNLAPKNDSGKLASFLKTVRENGVELKEPAQYKMGQPWDQHRQEKPWEIFE